MVRLLSIPELCLNSRRKIDSVVGLNITDENFNRAHFAAHHITAEL
jgi:hypothetical protein